MALSAFGRIPDDEPQLASTTLPAQIPAPSMKEHFLRGAGVLPDPELCEVLTQRLQVMEFLLERQKGANQKHGNFCEAHVVLHSYQSCVTGLFYSSPASLREAARTAAAKDGQHPTLIRREGSAICKQAAAESPPGRHRQSGHQRLSSAASCK